MAAPVPGAPGAPAPGAPGAPAPGAPATVIGPDDDDPGTDGPGTDDPGTDGPGTDGPETDGYNYTVKHLVFVALFAAIMGALLFWGFAPSHKGELGKTQTALAAAAQERDAAREEAAQAAAAIKAAEAKTADAAKAAERARGLLSGNTNLPEITAAEAALLSNLVTADNKFANHWVDSGGRHVGLLVNYNSGGATKTAAYKFVAADSKFVRVSEDVGFVAHSLAVISANRDKLNAVLAK